MCSVTMGPTRKKIRLVPMVLGLLCCGAVALAQDERIPRAVVSLINKHIQGTVRVNAWGFTLPNRITLTNMSLRDPDGAMVSRADRVTAKVDLAALALGELILDDLQIYSPVLNVEVDAQNNINVLRAIAPRQGSDGAEMNLTLSIEAYAVTNGTMTIKTPDMDAVLSGAMADGHLVLTGTTFALGVAVQAPTLNATVAGVSVAALAVRAKGLRYSGKTLVVPEAAFTVKGAGESTLSGRVVLTGKENLALAGHVKLPAGYWPKGLGDAPFATGALEGAYTVKGAFEDPQATLEGTVAHVQKDAYRVEDLAVTAAITKHKATASKARGAFAGGRVAFTGSYTFGGGATQANVTLKDAGLKALGADGVDGRLDGTLDVDGLLTRDVTRLGVVLDGAVKGLRRGDIHAVAPVLVRSRLTWRGQTVRILDLDATTPGARVAVRGTYGLDTRKLDLQTRATVEELARFVGGLPKGARLANSEARVLITGTTQKPRYHGAANLSDVEGFGVPAQAVVLTFKGDEKRVDVTQMKGRVAGGPLLGQGSLGLDKKGALSGRLQVRGANASGLHLEGLALEGKVDANVTLGGTTDVPVVGIKARGHRMVVEKERVKDIWVEATLRGRALDAKLVRAHMARGELLLRGRYHLDDKTVDGTLDGAGLWLRELTAVDARGLDGVLTVHVQAKGPLASPAGEALVLITDLGRGATQAGTARLDVTSDGKEALGTLAVPGARVTARGRYTFAKKEGVLDATVDEADLGLFTALSPGLPVVDGVLTAGVQAQGKVDDPDLRARVVIKDASLPPKHAKEATLVLGDATLTVEHSARLLTADARVFGVLQLQARGKTGPDDLVTVQGILDGDHLERFAPQLQRAEATLVARGRVNLEVPVRAMREARGVVLLSTVELRMGAVDGVTFTNDGEVLLGVADELVLLDQVRITGPDMDLELRGRVGAQLLDVQANGQADLVVLPAFTREVTRGQGRVVVDAKVARGKDIPLHVEGELTPEVGATVVVRSLVHPVVVAGGNVTATLDVLRFNNLRATSGDGELELSGVVKLLEGAPTALDVVAKAYGVVVPTARGRVTGGCDLALGGELKTPELSGTVFVTEGSLRQRYQVENFIVSTPSSEPTPPLHKRFPALAGLVLDVRFTADALRMRGDLGPYLLDASTRADFQVDGTLRDTSITGALEVAYGRVRIGQSTFDLESASVDFPLRSDAQIQPEVHVVARTVIPAERSPTLSEFPILLTLDGPLDRMVMDLRAVQETERISRMELLALAVTGRPATGALLGQGAASAGGDAALRLASSQALSGVERRVEDEARRLLDVPLEVRLEAGAGSGRATARWEYSSRLQLEGSTDLGYVAQQGFGLRSGGRARLVLLDHSPLPFLQTVAFEGNVSDVGLTRLDAQTVDMKLRLRLLEF